MADIRASGLTCLIHQAIYSGLTLVVMAKFDIEKFCKVVQDQRITFAYVVPPVVLLLGKHPIVDKYDLSSLRMMNSGAAPLTWELVDAVHKRLKVPIKQGYGLSETSPTTHTQVSYLAIISHEKGLTHTSSSPGKTGTRPPAPSAVSSPTKPPSTSRPKKPKYPRAKPANSGLKARTSSKATSTTPKAPKTRSQKTDTSRPATSAIKIKMATFTSPTVLRNSSSIKASKYHLPNWRGY